ncbi:hypothetical protein HPB49_005345 [Dermacentor silvarum]|uniref:Uncharacterized protein n=1 Tax=Dermacentor silvarum TaxID=543639 RepID=A0ACB8DN82_DERSI|nr:hypothetical protein HPB49_005345 [Dermacentor silvarum]
MDVYKGRSNPADSDNVNAYVACATTGKVALGGVNVHAALKLSLKTDGGTFHFAFRNVKCVIIDQVSTMSAFRELARDSAPSFTNTCSPSAA